MTKDLLLTEVEGAELWSEVKSGRRKEEIEIISKESLFFLVDQKLRVGWLA